MRQKFSLLNVTKFVRRNSKAREREVTSTMQTKIESKFQRDCKFFTQVQLLLVCSRLSRDPLWIQLFPSLVLHGKSVQNEIIKLESSRQTFVFDSIQKCDEMKPFTCTTHSTRNQQRKINKIASFFSDPIQTSLAMIYIMFNRILLFFLSKLISLRASPPPLFLSFLLAS